GGIAGVRAMVADFHRRGVRVLFPMMMWDQGTRDPGMPWPDAIAKLMAEIDADGINGDTEHGVARAFPDAADKVGHPLVFEPELGPDDEALAYNLMSWGHFKYPFAPTVDRYKWIEPRHMVNISDRWKKNKIDNLQFAFFNGVGWESWENIWGIWNGLSPADAEATRRMATLERGIAPFLVSPDWEPFSPMLQYGVFSSRWPLASQTVWTIVNRNGYDVSGQQIDLPSVDGIRYFDLYHGVEITPRRSSGRDLLNFTIEARGFAALFACAGPPPEAIQQLLAKMKLLTAKPISSFSSEWKVLSQQIVAIPATRAATPAPPGMVKIPGGEFAFRVHGIEIEGGNDTGVDVQYPWENGPRRFHSHLLTVNSFWIDEFPVTNAEFEKFIEASQYHPHDDLNFLHDWNNGAYPPGWDNKPVTWVSLEDARAYAAWAGKRLPHEWEWQGAAQGTDGRTYPWGNTWNSAAVPVTDKSRELRGPDNVDAHPLGASPFGVMDLVGNVWQWTDEFTDEHTRAGIVRGGSYYHPQGSDWYFPEAYRNDEHGKILLMAPSKDRAGTLGFRCVQDAK
ncbi:MAG: SUMF1/EgtB/PvdO family nonheme iron enzyme, partial [Candidatus Acidiferrum sp.]